MKEFLNSLRFKILAAVLIVLFGFIIASVYTGGAAPLFSQLMGFVTTPMQRLSSGITGGVTGFFEKFLSAGEVYEQNRRLQGEINELRRQLADYQKVKQENEQFREIIGVMEDQKDWQPVPAVVIARDPAERFYSFSIDKGSLDGISRLDPVMTADGLIGYVSETGMTYARVVTILDVSVDVGAYSSATRDVGIVSGTVDLAMEGRCQMQYLPRESEAARGDIILTSGGSLFPRDIIIGKITKVEPSRHGTGLVATIEPAAQVRTVKNVFVITSFEGKGER